jgi:hypothetical protein
LLGERKIGEHERELLDAPVFEKLRIGNGAGTGLDVGFEAVSTELILPMAALLQFISWAK